MARAATTNGAVILPNTDGRTVWVRRLADLMALITLDLGGEDAISEMERGLVRRIATQQVAIEKLEAAFAQDGAADDKALDLHQRLSNTLRRNQEALGLKRRSKDITPTLDAYLARQGQA
ncbi:hypothetical protein FJV83_24195 [Mesorhizobium sp. WSM4307]|uniref:hypothetical protein n=2 Tax=unclassified Mesorhizobium TaxID=325217 RepID=UPI00115ECBA7|nr:hypothetical protein [Mesorhizobium sp. WSM4315]TRC76887.1 hypothetical protein FJV81_14765 [Mesorhizobium sp. WSM4315]TRC81280.1 hypothetical protein FJV83_24195 [Mesorhizobium sp. WSM4307]